MTVLLSHLWPALVAAAILGFGVSVLFGPGAGLPSAILPVRLGIALSLLAAALVSALGVVPGRPGLWFDIVTLCVWAYAGGVAAGLLLRRLAGMVRSRKREGSPPPAAPIQLG